MNIDKALEIATKAHAGQVDKGGVPYIEHPIAVANAVIGESAKVVALLHDVLEDSNITLDYLIKEGLTIEQEKAVVALTKGDSQDYFDYILRIKDNNIATVVKIADLEHNMQLDRLKTVSDKDFKRWEKYKKAHDFLTKN